LTASTSTALDGNPTAVRHAADWVLAMAERLHNISHGAYGARNTLDGHWGGVAGDRARTRLDQLGAAADTPGDRASQLAAAMFHFADELDGVRRDLDAARTKARACRLVLTATSIQLPTVTVPMAPLDGPFREVCALVAAARARETRAHTALQAALTTQGSVCSEQPTLTSASDWVELAITASTPAATRGLGRSAALNKRLAQAAATIAHSDTVNPALRITAYNQALTQDALFTGKVAGGQALARGVDLFTIGTRTVRVPYVSAVFTGYNIAEDINSGDPTDKAVVKEVGSTAAGAIATGATAAALAGGPVTLVAAGAIGAGFVVSIGVGYLVDHLWPSPPSP
jgi:hypothetical protein